MLCTRCQQREATTPNTSPDVRARAEALVGAAWPLPEPLCKQCLEEVAQEPEFKARMDAFGKAAAVKVRGMIEEDIRKTALKVLDLADRLAEKLT